MSLSLIWQNDLHFKSGPDSPPLELDSSNPAMPSPMQALAFAVMGCMAMDVVHILQKGRHDLRGLVVSFDGTRATEQPKRYTGMHLTFEVAGDVPEDAVTRAIALSRDKYCSVLSTLDPGLDFRSTVTRAQ